MVHVILETKGDQDGRLWALIWEKGEHWLWCDDGFSDYQWPLTTSEAREYTTHFKTKETFFTPLAAKIKRRK